MRLLKLVLKCAFLIGLSMVLEVALLGPAASLLATDPLDELGTLGAKIMLFLLAVLVPTTTSTFVVGILGGLWVGGGKNIGYVVAFILGLIHLVIIIERVEISFDVQGLIILAGIPAIVLSGGFTYRAIYKRRVKKLGI